MHCGTRACIMCATCNYSFPQPIKSSTSNSFFMQKGSLRYSFEMIRAMFALYRASYMARIPPHNCRPQWVHLLSSSCVPVRPCKEFHSWLRARPGVNRLTAGRRFSTRIVKASQWSTLWSVRGWGCTGRACPLPNTLHYRTCTLPECFLWLT